MGKSMLHRKEQLILATIEIIDEIGILKLSTREIARRLEISEATLFRHYSSKNELLLAVLDYFSQFDNDIVQSTKLKGLKGCEGLKYLVAMLSKYYESYPAMISIMQLNEVLRYESDLEVKLINITEGRMGYIQQLIDEAKNTEEIKHNIDSESLAAILYGSFKEICLKWRVSNKHFSLNTKMMETFDMILSCIKN